MAVCGCVGGSECLGGAGIMDLGRVPVPLELAVWRGPVPLELAIMDLGRILPFI